MTVSFLVEVDKLIQLLESPVFTYLRLHLLEPQRHASLIKALYGLLMLLPQSSAFHTLKNRLDCIPTVTGALDWDSQDVQTAGDGVRAKIAFAELVAHFSEVQKMHQEAIDRGERSRASVNGAT